MAIMRAFCFNTGRNPAKQQKSSKTTFWHCRLNRNMKDKLGLFICFMLTILYCQIYDTWA